MFRNTLTELVKKWHKSCSLSPYELFAFFEKYSDNSPNFIQRMKNDELHIKQYKLVLNHLCRHIALFSHTHPHAPGSYLFALSPHLSPFPPLTHPCARPLTRDKPLPPFDPGRREGGGGPLSPTKAWMAQGSAHSLGEQEIFVPGGEGWREKEGGREHERDANTTWAYILFIKVCNMHQKKIDTQPDCRGAEGMCSCRMFSIWIRGQTNSLSEMAQKQWQ